MKNLIIAAAFLFLANYAAISQVGIGNTDPNASLDISASNVATPNNDDGLLIPRIDEFPLTSPTATQDGMMVFITGDGTPTKGFYYWDQDAGPAAWVRLSGTEDADWFEAGTTNAPSDNTDDIFTLGYVGIGASVPDNPLYIGTTTSFDLSYANTGQDGVFIIGGGSGGGLDAVGGSISFGPPANTRSTDRKSAIASVQTSGDVDHTGLAFYVHGNSINQSPMVEGMRLTHQRYLGINNPAPSATLDVIGTMQFEDGNEAAGYILSSDANGNASWADPSTIVSDDADWFGEGTTAPPTAITDDIFTQGNVAIGKNTADYPLDIELTGSVANPILTQMVDNSSGTGDHTGLQQTMSGGHNGTVKGIETFITNTGNGLHTAISTSVQNGTGNQIGIRNTVNGSFGDNTLYSGGILSVSSTTNNTQTGLDISIAQATSQITYGIFSSLNAAGSGSSGIKYGFYNLIDGGLGTHYGVYNDVRGISNNTKYGTYNLFGIGTTNTGGILYGTYNAFGNSITSTTDKYGTFTNIPSGLGGTHYGTYSDVRNATGFAAYFIGRTSLGTGTTNRYIMPAADGTNGQVMTTDGAGNITFTTPADDNDWTTVGANIERQSGNVYIGDTNATDNDLFISDRIFDWDNTSYYLNPDDTSVMDEIQFDNGSSSDPSIRFSDIDTGFYSPVVGAVSFAGNGTERFRIQNDGEIQFRTTTPTNYDFTALGVFGNDGISVGSSSATVPILDGFIANDSRDNILRLDVQSGNSNFDHSTIYATNNIGGTTARLTYNDGTITGRYAVYADGGTGYAGYFLGDLAIGTTSANTYTLPASRGTNGQTMQTDGAGNVSWVNPATSEWTDGGTFIYPTDGTTEDVVIGQNTSGTGRLTIDAGTKAASIVTNKSGTFSGLHYGVNNYISNSGGGASVGVNNLLEGTGGSNLRFGTRTIINGSSSTTAVSHYGSYNQINTTGTGFRYGTYNEIATTAGGTHYGTYNSVAATNGWAGYFLGKSYISEKLGIGTGATNPNGFLEVRANNSGSEPNLNLVDIGSSGARINFSNTGTTNGNVWTFFADTDNTIASSRFNLFHTTTGNVLQILGDGRVGIMRAPATNRLEVNGNASKSTAGDWLANSDRRLKKNITTIDSKSALDRITSLRGVTYEWNDHETGNDRPDGVQYGFIAQELMQVFPENVSKDNLGFYQTAYGTYDALYVQAFKEQQKQIEALQNENKKLLEKLAQFESLEARLSALENKTNTSAEEALTAEKK